MILKILLVIATSLLIIARNNYIYFVFSIFESSIKWDYYFTIIQNLTYTYSLLFYIFFFIEYYFKGIIEKYIYIIRKKIFNSFSKKKIKSYFFKLKFNFKNDNIIIIIIFIIGIIIRIYKLKFTITYDEAATYMDYVDEGLTSLFFYKSPNNHIFHSILAKIAVSIFGENQYALRLPAILFGSLNIILIYFISRKISNKLAGIISCFFLSAYPIIIDYDTLARGYSIITTCSLLLFYCCWEYIRTLKLRFLILIPIISSFGFFTHLPFLFSFTGIVLWFFYELFTNSRFNNKNILPYIIFISTSTLFICLVLYTPTLILGQGIDQFLNNKYFISSNMFGEYPKGLFIFFIKLNHYFFFKSKTIFLFVVILLVINYSKTKKMIIFFALQLITFFLITGLIKSIPPERTFLFILPFIIISISISISSLVITHYKKIIFLPLIQLQLMFYLVNQNTFQKYNGYPEIPFLVEFLKQDSLPILAVDDRYAFAKSLKYYFQINKINQPIKFISSKNINKEDLTNLDNSIYIIINKNINVPKNNFNKLFEYNNYQILQPTDKLGEVAFFGLKI